MVGITFERSGGHDDQESFKPEEYKSAPEKLVTRLSGPTHPSHPTPVDSPHQELGEGDTGQGNNPIKTVGGRGPSFFLSAGRQELHVLNFTGLLLQIGRRPGMIEVLAGSYPLARSRKEDDRNFLGPDPNSDNGNGDEGPPRLREAARGSGEQRHHDVANGARNRTQVHPSGTMACGRCGAVNDGYSSLARPVLTCTAHNQPRI